MYISFTNDEELQLVNLDQVKYVKVILADGGYCVSFVQQGALFNLKPHPTKEEAEAHLRRIANDLGVDV